MKVAGFREFKKHASKLLQARDVVFVTRRGKLSGLLVSLDSPRELPRYLRRDILEKLGESISRHLSERGLGQAAVHRDFKAWRARRGASKKRHRR